MKKAQWTEQGEQTRKAILEYVDRYLSYHKYPPSIRDIMEGCGISSTSMVHHHLEVLQAQGMITRQDGIPRSIVLCN